MAKLNFKTIWDSLFTKSQKAEYALVNDPKKEQGQPAPLRYSPEIHEKIYKTPQVFMAIDTIAKEVSKVDWEIVPRRDVLDIFGAGTNEGKSVAVMTMKEYAHFKRAYTDLNNQNKITTTTKQHIKDIYNLLNDPNENQENLTSIIQKIAVDLKVHDAAAIEKIRNGLGEIVEIYTAPAAYVRMNYDKNGKLLDPAYIQIDKNMVHNKVAEWCKDELIYMMLNPISTSMYGISPLDVIAQIVATLVNALNYNGTYFESAALPEGFFTIPGLSETAAKRLMKKWEQEIKNKPHKVAFFPEGAKWHQFRFTNVEMQWLQGQKFYAEIVYAVLGVTKSELGFTEDVNKASDVSQSRVIKNRSIIPILNLFANKINQELIGKDGFNYGDVMFIFKNVDLADKETMDKIHDRAVKSGRMTINETREEAGKAPYDGFGDDPVIATSQGLVFLEQFYMKFQEFKQEFDMLQEESQKANVPIAELRRQRANTPKNPEPNDNNTNNQPTTQPSPAKPAADDKPDIDETKNIVEVDGLKALVNKIDKVIDDEKTSKNT